MLRGPIGEDWSDIFRVEYDSVEGLGYNLRTSVWKNSVLLCFEDRKLISMPNESLKSKLSEYYRFVGVHMDGSTSFFARKSKKGVKMAIFGWENAKNGQILAFSSNLTLNFTLLCSWKWFKILMSHQYIHWGQIKAKFAFVTLKFLF